MSRSRFAALVLGSLLVLPAWTQEKKPNAEQEYALAELKKLGARVRIEEKGPGQPDLAIDLSGCTVNEAGLVHLKALKNLRTLDL